MMRPMKLAGSQLMFGKGCLEHLKTLKGKKAIVVIGGQSVVKSGMLDKVLSYLKEAGMETLVHSGVKADPKFHEVVEGANAMHEFNPDWIVALGGGSVMDAAKAMWVLYEHPEVDTLEKLSPPNKIPPLRNKAHFCCIPSTAGTASEVSRSIVISDDETHMKVGIGDMEMMPDVAICDPEVTISMPANITADTGMDAMTHAMEAYVSTRANYVSDILAAAAIKDIYHNLPLAYKDGKNIEYREKMLNAQMIAGLAFTNVSLGIVHSIAHTLGSYFGIPHGLACAIVMPYIIRYNCKNEIAKAKYEGIQFDDRSMDKVIEDLNASLDIPKNLLEYGVDVNKYKELLEVMAINAINDGCTKTNPLIPDVETMKSLFLELIGE